MSIGIALSPFGLDASDNAVDAAVVLGKEAAAVGVSSLWFGQLFSHDTIGLAGIVGREVPELEVGTSVVPIAARHPLLMSSQAQTAQAATHGRFTLGVGLGARFLTESAFGAPYDRPIARLREFLAALRGVLANGEVEFRGETLTAVTPMPAVVAGAEPTVPVLVAAMGPQALRVTAELADGTMPFLVGPQALAEHIVAPITAAAEQAGRPRPRIVAMVPGVVTADVDTARATATEQMAFYNDIPSYKRMIELSGASHAADLAVIGDERALADQIAAYFDAGATDVVVAQTDLATDADRRRTWQVLGELNRARTA
ncbi:LLM class F420-dependent oxidoreductase [Nocardia sp. NBC_00565]|uniref:LLM class F420-dependent oxidoreductase n=1 Tax=Nocardia sp. NBC_00565 TaxID=2975993 RepID=UPI002E802BFE|nr:LLM class F420-dependent oxidoreductase [Nocardia sp. NBC_00565]WUC04481.1 LLM class F420-dependent oxidoreductase [Nocardia sp. NBC_00565]